MEIKSAIKLIVENHIINGTISSDRFHAILSDYSPEFSKERRILKLAIDDDLLKLVTVNTDNSERLQYHARLLLEDKGLSRQWIDFILESFAYAYSRPYSRSNSTASELPYVSSKPRDNTSVMHESTKIGLENRNNTSLLFSSDYEVGDIIQLGSYYSFPKYNNHYNYAYERIPIDWIILAISNKKALLISKMALDSKPYNKISGDITWNNCSLRHWLNTDFIKDAFSAQERNQIINAYVPIGSFTTPTLNGTDQVFLLSYEEVMRYLPTNALRVCKATDYAKKQGAWVDPVNGNCRWWLRTHGTSFSAVSSVGVGGFVFTRGYPAHNANGAVRPAIWINLDA